MSPRMIPFAFVGACMAVAAIRQHLRYVDALGQLASTTASTAFTTSNRVSAIERWAWGGGSRA